MKGYNRPSSYWWLADWAYSSNLIPAFINMGLYIFLIQRKENILTKKEKEKKIHKVWHTSTPTLSLPLDLPCAVHPFLKFLRNEAVHFLSCVCWIHERGSSVLRLPLCEKVKAKHPLSLSLRFLLNLSFLIFCRLYDMGFTWGLIIWSDSLPG